jgi:hypothetical protein
VGVPPPQAAAPVLVNHGVIDEHGALDIFFPAKPSGQAFIDKTALTAVFNLLRTESARQRMMFELARYSGIIAEDANDDGIYESLCEYKHGLPVHNTHDKNQEGAPALTVNFIAGLPVNAVVSQALPFSTVTYEAYPAVQSVSLDGKEYFFRPQDFYFAPIRFEELCEEGGILFPQLSDEGGSLTERALLAFASIIERPSKEFPGAVERTRLLDGIVISARETLNGKTISETEYVNGKPVLQRVDTDLDGRMETTRHFVQNSADSLEIDYIESDWNGDGTAD